jgi:AcrR family transcriptional regulator
MPAGGDPARRRRSRREERKEETRAELIAAAATEFAARGFHGASVEQIARSAGYSTGAIYWHFSGKDDLFLAVYEAYATARVREFEEVHQHAPVELPLWGRAFADQWMARLHDDPESLVLLAEFFAYAWRNPELRKEFGHRAAAGRLALARLLDQQATAVGATLPIPADDLATVLRELATGVGLAKLADPDAIRDALLGDFVELFFRLAESRDQDPPPDRTGKRRSAGDHRARVSKRRQPPS